MRFKVVEEDGVYLVKEGSQNLCYSTVKSNAVIISNMMNKHYLAQQSGFTVLTTKEALNNISKV